MKIPKIFHHVWLGNKLFPEEFKKYRNTWIRWHPDWEFVFWQDDNLPEIINRFEFDNALNFAQKCDILKYEIVWNFGGVYLDTDFECFKNIEPLLKDVEVFSASEKPPLISVGIFGAVRNHHFLQKMISELPNSFKTQIHDRQDLSTGPGLMTHVAKNNPITVFGPKLFYPYHFTEKHRRNELFPEAYASHHWAHSWDKHKHKIKVV
jgi:mannosyltransferase OCH1-like enzyme